MFHLSRCLRKLDHYNDRGLDALKAGQLPAHNDKQIQVTNELIRQALRDEFWSRFIPVIDSFLHKSDSAPSREGKALFAALAKAYRFGNPRLLGRLYLAWRLLKALRYGSYRYEEIENGLRLLFWRECRLQQEAEKRDGLDDWFAALGSEAAPTPAESLKDLSNTLEAVANGLALVKGDSNWSCADALVDAVLLPASAKLPEKDKSKDKRPDAAQS